MGFVEPEQQIIVQVIEPETSFYKEYIAEVSVALTLAFIGLLSVWVRKKVKK